MLHWPWEFNNFCVLPKCVCLSLLQLVVTPALNYCVSSPFAGLLLSWALLGGFILLSFSSCHLLFLCCHSRVQSFRTLLLVLIALFLAAVVFLPSKSILYQSPQCLHFLTPPPLVPSLLSHQNPSLNPTSHLAIHQPCSSWLSYICSFYSDCKSSNFPCWPLSEILHPALTPHFISSCYPWQSSTSWLLSSFQPLSSSGCSFDCSSFLLAVSYLCLYCSTLHTICCAAAWMINPEKIKILLHPQPIH